mmetsp:Transcript_24083/g.71993  ORF Transcript_24083/g.71993 Transcript_24083/m.71993 type:complete len:202 (-) Transcript_24083:87-692(-)
MSSSGEAKTSCTRPNRIASSGPKSRPVKAKSRTQLSQPTTFGRRCRVPTSAARPTLASRTEKTACFEHSRMSHAVMMSMPAPMQGPCTAATTGFWQRSKAVTKSWNPRTKSAMTTARRPGSRSAPAAPSMPSSDMSMPAEKTFPSAETTTVRTAGSAENAARQAETSRRSLMLTAFLEATLASRKCPTPSATVTLTSSRFE